MRVLRACIVTVIALGAFLVPSAASAQVDEISIGDPRLGPEGATVVVPVNVVCQVGYNLAFGSASVAQSTGHKLAQGTDSFFNEFPGVPCTGAPQVLTVSVATFTSFAFKQGKATASANATVFNPVTFELITEVAGPQGVRITK